MSQFSKTISIVGIIAYLTIAALSLLSGNDRVDIYAFLAVGGVLFVLSNNAWIRYCSIPAVVCAVILLLYANSRDIKYAIAAGRLKEKERLRAVLEKKGIILEKIENDLVD